MTTQAGARIVIDEQNPWPGLHPFDEAAQRFFNGRREESLELRSLVPQAPLTVLFGASGLGKTSLLKAGLFPLLRRDHFLPVYIHLDVTDHTRPLLGQAKLALQEQIDALRIDAPACTAEQSLWEYLHQTDLELWSPQNQLLTPVFVFDQFEEVFTLGAEHPAAIAQLRIDLADLVENRIPAALANRIAKAPAAAAGLSLNRHGYKVLLSFREDFLPALEGETRHRDGWKRELPSIVRNRLRLLPMSGDRAFEAVHDSASHLIEPALARKIVHFVAASEDGSRDAGPGDGLTELVVEPALLSVVCHGLNEKRKALGKPRFDDTLVRGSGRAIIAEFYDQAVEDLPDHVQRFLEDNLVTEHGFRKPCDLDDAISVHGVTEPQLRSLVDRRLLRIEPQRGRSVVELTHDLLTPIVRERRDRYRAKAQVLKQRHEQRRKWGRVLALAAVAALLSVSASLFSRIVRSDQRQNANAARWHAHGLALDRRYGDALNELARALYVFETREISNDQIATLLDIGDIYAQWLQADLAIPWYQRALQISRSTENPSLEGKALQALAIATERTDGLQAAMLYYGQAVRAYQDGADYLANGELLERLGAEAESSMDSEQAIDWFTAASRSYTSAGNQLGSVRVQRVLARLESWGFLVDLHSSAVHELKSDIVAIGRDLDIFGIPNEISFPDEAISTMQLIMTRNRQLNDLRSERGTSLNAQILFDVDLSSLKDGDIIVLANVRALQFRTRRPSRPVSVPADAWAIFIDGNSRSYSYLTAPEYSLESWNATLSLVPGSSASAALGLRRGPDGAEMLAVDDPARGLPTWLVQLSPYAVPLPTWLAQLSSYAAFLLGGRPVCQFMMMIKSPGDHYDFPPLPTGDWIDLKPVPLMCRDSARNPSFQIVPLQPRR